jgi:Ca-activated chloride channel family protein
MRWHGSCVRDGRVATASALRAAAKQPSPLPIGFHSAGSTSARIATRSSDNELQRGASPSREASESVGGAGVIYNDRGGHAFGAWMRRRTFGLGIVGLVGAATCGTCGPWRDECSVDAVDLQGGQDVKFVPAGRAAQIWAVLRVTAEMAECEERPPINVALVIDTSGSMEGAAIEAAREAATAVVDALQDGDRITLVTFDSEARLLVESTEIDSGSRDDVRDAIQGMPSHGTTDLARGLGVALQDLQRVIEPGVLTRLVLLSDGVPNDAAPIASLAAQASAMGITVTAFGFGLDYDPALLGGIAQTTGGSFHYIEDASEIAPMFRAENARLQGVVARGMALTLVTGPRVTIAEVLGDVGGAGESLVLGLGDLSRGEERVVAVRLAVDPHRDDAPVELLDASLTYHDPLTGKTAVHESIYLAAYATSDAAQIEDSRDPAIEAEVARQRAGATALHAVLATQRGDLAEADRLLRAAVPEAAAGGEGIRGQRAGRAGGADGEPRRRAQFARARPPHEQGAWRRDDQLSGASEVIFS